MHYIFDIDGTLSFDGKAIQPEIIKSIQLLEHVDNKVSFASARPIRDLIPIIPEFSKNHLLIGGNGSIVQTQENQIVVSSAINNDSFSKIKKLCLNFNLSYVVDDAWNFATNVESNKKYFNK